MVLLYFSLLWNVGSVGDDFVSCSRLFYVWAAVKMPIMGIKRYFHLLSPSRDVARHGLGGGLSPPNEKLALPNEVQPMLHYGLLLLQAKMNCGW